MEIKTKEELFEALEPITIEYKKTRKVPEMEVQTIAASWLIHSGLEMEEAFDVWNNVMADLVVKHDIRKYSLN